MAKNKPEWLILHHTVTPYTWNVESTIEQVNPVHAKRGFPKSSLGYHVGYHYLIDRNGKIGQTRADTDEGAHCLSSDTEVLTARGWLKYTDVIESDLVATFNSQENIIEFQGYSRKIIKTVNEELINIKNQSVDILCTKEHRTIYRSIYNRGRDPKFLTSKADELLSGNFLLPCSANSTGMENVDENRLAVAVFAVADGSYQKRDNKIHCVRFKLKKQRKVDHVCSYHLKN